MDTFRKLITSMPYFISSPHCTKKKKHVINNTLVIVKGKLWLRSCCTD